jgi:hypothetical protein
MQNGPDPQTPTAPHKPGWWAPRFWLGANFPTLIKIFARNGFRIGPRQLYVALADLFYSVFHSMLRVVQQVIYGRRVTRVEIKEQPLFILGHWRCGTTLLHELLILDSRHTFPTTWECLSPNHFLLTEWLAVRTLGWLLPEQRPMDNMLLGWDRPQEDEFALCNLGIPSPYLTIAFPNNPPQYPEYLEMEQVPQPDRERWKQTLLTFLKQITFRNPKRIILKSPPHTARIKILLELFPDARFVYITRNPYKVFPSTVHLWKSLYATHGLQTPRYEGLDEYVYDTFNRIFRQYEATRGLIDPSRLYELKYEELVADPMGQMRALYEQLELGGFDQVQPAIEAYFAEQQEYKTNRYPQPEEERAEIRRRWRDYFDRYGYSVGEPDSKVASPTGSQQST